MGKVNPRSVKGLTCCWAKSGGSCGASCTTTVVGALATPVSSLRAARPAKAVKDVSMLLIKDLVAVMFTVPAAWMIAGANDAPAVDTKVSPISLKADNALTGRLLGPG